MTAAEIHIDTLPDVNQINHLSRPAHLPAGSKRLISPGEASLPTLMRGYGTYGPGKDEKLYSRLVECTLTDHMEINDQRRPLIMAQGMPSNSFARFFSAREATAVVVADGTFSTLQP